MDEQIRSMPFEELKTLHREIGALLAERKHEKLEEMRAQIAILGFTAADLAPPKTKAAHRSAAKYRNPETGDVWGGRGHRPQWIKGALEDGRQLEEFLITS